MSNHTDDSYLWHKERAIFFLCRFSFSEWAQWLLYLQNTSFVVFLHFLQKFRAARPVINQLYFLERHFSANGISLCLGEVQMKIYERSLQALLSSTAARLRLLCLGGSLRLPKWRACLHAVSFVSQALFLCLLIHVIVTKTIAICRLLHTTSIRS